MAFFRDKRWEMTVAPHSHLPSTNRPLCVFPNFSRGNERKWCICHLGASNAVLRQVVEALFICRCFFRECVAPDWKQFSRITPQIKQLFKIGFFCPRATSAFPINKHSLKRRLSSNCKRAIHLSTGQKRGGDETVFP